MNTSKASIVHGESVAPPCKVLSHTLAATYKYCSSHAVPKMARFKVESDFFPSSVFKFQNDSSNTPSIFTSSEMYGDITVGHSLLISFQSLTGTPLYSVTLNKSCF